MNIENLEGADNTESILLNKEEICEDGTEEEKEPFKVSKFKDKLRYKYLNISNTSKAHS
jgi:hypothetical protein